MENIRLRNAFDADRKAENELSAVCKALGVRGNSYYRVDECLRAIKAMKKSGGITPTMQQAIFRMKADAEIMLRELETSEGEAKDG